MPIVRGRVAARPPRWTRPERSDALALALKHALDRFAAAAGLLATAPLIVVLVLALRRRGSVLAHEPMIGEDRRVILLPSLAIPADWRLLNRLGLRALPQLWTMLRGELSLVGPRSRPPGAAPPPIRPGLTGLAQLHPDTTLADRLALDDHYAHSWSLALDARILARTVVRARMPGP
jgi:lipopolysaccharide/colanic/teichoic acid biosynthesis glycosyltransferase